MKSCFEVGRLYKSSTYFVLKKEKEKKDAWMWTEFIWRRTKISGELL
jgi:hypothetical protein